MRRDNWLLDQNGDPHQIIVRYSKVHNNFPFGHHRNWTQSYVGSLMMNRHLHFNLGQSMTNLIDQFADQSIPFVVLVLIPVQSIAHQSDGIVEMVLTLVDNLFEQVNAIAVESVVPFGHIVRDFHHERCLLQEEPSF